MRKFLLTALCISAVLKADAKDNSLLFIENVGQFTDQFHRSRSDIDFGLRAGGMNVFVEAGAIHYQFMNRDSKDLSDLPRLQNILFPFSNATNENATSAMLNIHRMDVELLGANKNVQPIKEGKLQYYERYYTPQFGEDGGKALAYSKIIYKDIYPHIDQVLYINGEQIEYDFIVKEGGNPADIRLQYKGVNSLSLDPQGNLVATTSHGNITEHAPVAWQEDGRKVAASFKLNDGVVCFDVAKYKGSLLIDPYLEWATYYGGAGDDNAAGVEEDASGNMYLGGWTQSASNIATIGSYDVTYADSADAYIVKFNSSGTRLWGTYYGGIGVDESASIAYDHNGNIYISGMTDNATGIATSGSDQPIFSGPHVGGPFPFIEAGDAFLVKFDSAGSRLWGTYFGGNNIDIGYEVACDLIGNVYLSGYTKSINNIGTSGSHQQNPGGGKDGYLAKYGPSGQKIWATYYGGGGEETIEDLAVFQNNRVYITGITNSTNNIGTIGVYQSSLQSSTNGFIAAFDENGNRIWGTYFGGNTYPANTSLYAICSNAIGDIFVTGETNDATDIASTGAYQTSYGGSGDVVVAKFNNNGNRIWSTYLGGSGNDEGLGIETNLSGELYVGGYTCSPNGIAFNAFQGNYYGGFFGRDGLFAKFNDAGSCIWSTYLGGTQDDYLWNIKASMNNYVYVSGLGSSLPTTLGSHQPNFAGGMYDTYLAKFHDFPTGMTQVKSEANQFNIYPNPTNGIFNIEATIADADQNIFISICDITGRVVHSEQFRSNGTHFSKQIALSSSLPAGTYIVNIISGNYSATKHLIKN